MGLHIETCHGGHHQMCSFMWADIYWMEQMTKDSIEEGGEMGLGTQAGESVVDEKTEEMMIKTSTGLHKLLF